MAPWLLSGPLGRKGREQGCVSTPTCLSCQSYKRIADFCLLGKVQLMPSFTLLTMGQRPSFLSPCVLG